MNAAAPMKDGALLRMAQPVLGMLLDRIVPDPFEHEQGMFALFGWRDCGNAYVVTLVELLWPEPAELTATAESIRINHPYLRRSMQSAASRGLALGFVHSHPSDAPAGPSNADSEMDAYLASYTQDNVPGRPFVSLVLSRRGQEIAVSGKVRIGDRWTDVMRLAAERMPQVVAWPAGVQPPIPAPPPESVARMTSAFGLEAFQRLSRSTVALIGAGGTGSAAIPILARAGVGRLIVIDCDHVTISNLERLHGSVPADVSRAVPKAAVAKRAVSAFAPDCRVDAVVGRLPQSEIVDLVVQADLLLGCTDQHSSRIAVADIGRRYLVPAIDCGGLIEGADGIVTGQLIQIVRFLADDPCPICRGMISPVRVQQELLPSTERLDPAAQAELARANGLRPDPILTAIPQIDTVGYITTTAGTLAAGFAIGWLTGRFNPMFERLQLDLVSSCLGAVDRPQVRRPGCGCAGTFGMADQAPQPPAIVPPDHWPAVAYL